MEVPSRDQFDDLENKVARLEEQLKQLMRFCNVPKKYRVRYMEFDKFEDAENHAKNWVSDMRSRGYNYAGYPDIETVYEIPEESQ